MMYRMSNETNSFRAPNARSPFVRLRELLGDTPPGKPAISLAVGEPQHAIPSFVGPVIAAHVNDSLQRLLRSGAAQRTRTPLPAG